MCTKSTAAIWKLLYRRDHEKVEHKNKESCMRRETVCDHVWTHQHPILWYQTVQIDRMSLDSKKQHIRTKEGHFNRDIGTELPRCWPALINLNTSNLATMHAQVHIYIFSMITLPFTSRVYTEATSGKCALNAAQSSTYDPTYMGSCKKVHFRVYA